MAPVLGILDVPMAQFLYRDCFCIKKNPRLLARHFSGPWPLKTNRITARSAGCPILEVAPLAGFEDAQTKSWKIVILNKVVQRSRIGGVNNALAKLRHSLIPISDHSFRGSEKRLGTARQQRR